MSDRLDIANIPEIANAINSLAYDRIVAQPGHCWRHLSCTDYRAYEVTPGVFLQANPPEYKRICLFHETCDRDFNWLKYNLAKEGTTLALELNDILDHSMCTYIDSHDLCANNIQVIQGLATVHGLAPPTKVSLPSDDPEFRAATTRIEIKRYEDRFLMHLTRLAVWIRAFYQATWRQLDTFDPCLIRRLTLFAEPIYKWDTKDGMLLNVTLNGNQPVLEHGMASYFYERKPLEDLVRDFPEFMPYHNLEPLNELNFKRLESLFNELPALEDIDTDSENSDGELPLNMCRALIKYIPPEEFIFIIDPVAPAPTESTSTDDGGVYMYKPQIAKASTNPFGKRNPLTRTNQIVVNEGPIAVLDGNLNVAAQAPAPIHPPTKDPRRVENEITPNPPGTIISNTTEEPPAAYANGWGIGTFSNSIAQAMANGTIGFMRK